MRLGIMQPYFFPYLGYFQLIKNTDRFILFDDVQYIRHGWINRNRILKPGGGWQYFVGPLQKHSQTELIRNISFQDNPEWKVKITRQLEHYKKRAKFYEETMDLIKRSMDINETQVTKFNGNVLQLLCNELNVPFSIEISSAMNFDYSDVNDAGEWALRICEQLGADVYINPPGGKELFDESKFKNSKIDLRFLSPVLHSYKQIAEPFEPGLSIIDVLMFNGKQRTSELIHN